MPKCKNVTRELHLFIKKLIFEGYIYLFPLKEEVQALAQLHSGSIKANSHKLYKKNDTALSTNSIHLFHTQHTKHYLKHNFQAAAKNSKK